MPHRISDGGHWISDTSHAIPEGRDAYDPAPLIAFKSDHPYLQFLKQFRNAGTEVARGLCNDAPPPIVNITAVGALYKDKVGFSPRDAFWFKNVFRLCESLDVPVSDPFQMTPVCAVHRQDILDPLQPVPATDLLLVCHVVDPTTAKGMEHKREGRGNRGVWTSDHHTDEDWQRVARASGAKLVITFSEYLVGKKPGEIRSANFTGTGDFSLCKQEIIVGPSESYLTKNESRYLMECVVARNAHNMIGHPASANLSHATR